MGLVNLFVEQIYTIPTVPCEEILRRIESGEYHAIDLSDVELADILV